MARAGVAGVTPALSNPSGRVVDGQKNKKEYWKSTLLLMGRRDSTKDFLTDELCNSRGAKWRRGKERANEKRFSLKNESKRTFFSFLLTTTPTPPHTHLFLSLSLGRENSPLGDFFKVQPLKTRSVWRKEEVENRI